MMNEEGAFPRLVELIQVRKDDETGLHRMQLEVLYEMSRIQRLRLEDLSRPYQRAFLLSRLLIWCSANRGRLHNLHVRHH